jgi:hypothetical protein
MNKNKQERINSLQCIEFWFGDQLKKPDGFLQIAANVAARYTQPNTPFGVKLKK